MAANPFDQFDKPSANPFDQFDQNPAANPFDQFDRAERQAKRPTLVRTEPVVPPSAPTVTAPEPFKTSAEKLGAPAEPATQAPSIVSPEEMLTPLGETEQAAKRPAAAKPVALPTDPSKLQEGVLYKDRAGREYYWDASSRQLNKALAAEKPAPKSGSVFDEVTSPKVESLPGENRFGMNPEFVKAVEAQLNALPEAQRGAALQKLLARKDLYGRAAQDIQARYKQLDKLKTQALKRTFDPRLETQAAKLAVEGDMDPEAAQAWAAKELRLGRMPTILPQAVPDRAAELAQEEAARVQQEMEGAGFLDRVGAEMGTRMRQSSLGAAQIYADISGDKELDQRLRGLRQVEEARGEAIPKGDTIFERSAQQAIATLASTAPMKVLGAMTGFAAPVLSQMAFETFTTAYGQSRSAFKDPMEASVRAGLMTTAEVLFERFGLADQFKAIRGVVNGIPTKELSGYLSKAFLKEVPAELATTTSNFITDLAPQIGLNQNAGLKDYFDQAGETIRQTVIQGGASIGAVRGAAAAEQAYSTRVLPAISPERAVARAIRQGAEQAEPTPAALRALSVTGGLRAEPPQVPEAKSPAEQPTVPQAEPVQTAEPSGRIEPTFGATPATLPPEERIEPRFGAAEPRIPGMPTGEEVEETQEPVPLTNVSGAPQTSFFTPRGAGPQFTGSVAPTPAAARLPDTPTVAPTTQPKVFEPAAPQHQDLELPSVEVPLSQLKLSKDVPQFKYGASETGVVKPLGGKFSREGLAPIAVWERLDGSLEIISGRHRFDLAKRSGEKTIPAQVYRERDGFTAVDAAIKDAELNIRDDQGQVKDYVNYFKESGMDRETAESKGLLARDKGKRGFTIGNQGSDELIEAVRADKVSDAEAYYIALNAPNDSRLQAVGIKAIMDGKSANVATNMMQAVKALATENDTTLDMFGFDDSAIKEAEEMAKIAQKKQREVSDRLSAISGAAKRPEIAKAEGIDIKDPEAVKRRIDELRNLKAAWDNWSTNPELIAQIREARGVEAPKPFGLTAQTPEELEAQDRARQDREAAERAEKEARERKAKADEEVGEFVLTGSDREADEAAARGQEDLFAAPPKTEEKKPEVKVNPLQVAYDKAKADLDALGPEPVKPSSEKKFFGARGKAGASPELVKQYEDQVKRHAAWKRKYAPLKKKEVEAANALFRSKQEGGADKPNEEESGFRGASDAEVKQVADALGDQYSPLKYSEEYDGDLRSIFSAPTKNEVVRAEDKVRVYVKDAGYMTVAQAKERIEQWKKHTRKQGKEYNDNYERVVLSLFDLTGQWSAPWEEAGYQVYRFDIQADPEMGDVRKFDVQFFMDAFSMFEGSDIYAILAACPCTDFASSGAKHFAAKDADGRTLESVELVKTTLATIEYFKPTIWAIENPVGRIEKLTGLPPWRLSFNPNHFGDPYTKKTLLWGRFNADLPVAPVEPTEGSKMHLMYGGKSAETKNARSVTPEGFAYAFFMANNAIDNPVMAITNKYAPVDPRVLERALDVGMTEQDISEYIDDDFYDRDFEAAATTLQERIDEILALKAPDLDVPESVKTDDEVRQIPLPNGMLVRVFKTSDGYGTGLYDVDSGNYVNGSIIRYKGTDASDALDKANKRADDLVKEATPVEPGKDVEAESAAIDKTVQDQLKKMADDFMVGDLVRMGNMPGVVVGVDGDYVRFRPDAAKSPKAYQRVTKKSLTFVARPDMSGDVAYSREQDNKFGEEAGQLNANMGNLIQLLGANMYASALSDVSIKELLQNAFDAVKGATASVNSAGKKIKPLYKSGNIEISIDTGQRTISFKDDARGMTPEIVRQAFFTVAGSDKSDLPPSMRSGGLGLAKMGFMLGSKRLQLDTVRDGVRVTVDTTAQDIANSKFVIKKSPAPKGEHGTTVTVTIPEKYTDPKTGDEKTIYFPYSAKYIDPLQKPLIGPVNVKVNMTSFGSTETIELPVGTKFPEDKYSKFKANFEWGSADIYFSIERNTGGTYSIKHQVLSSGVYQFSPSFSIDNEKIPYDIIVDVKPNVDARHPDYPFENSRERFKGRLEEDIKSLTSYLGQIARGYEASDLQQSFKDIVSMPRLEAGKDLAGITDKLKKSFDKRAVEKPAELKPLPKEVTITADAVTDTETKKVLVDIKAKEEEKKKESSFKGDKIPTGADFMIDMKQNPSLPIFHNNTNVDFLEIGRQYGEPEKFFAELGTLLVEMKEELAKSNMYGYGVLAPDKLFFAGISIDKGYGGIHIKVPYKAVMVNPFYDFGAKTLFGVREQLLDTMIHEIAHTGSMDHGVAHNTQMLKVKQYLADEGLYDYYRDAIMEVLARHESAFTAMRDAYGQSTTRNTAKSLEDYGKGTAAASSRGNRGVGEYPTGAVPSGEGPERGEDLRRAEAAGEPSEVGRGPREVGRVTDGGGESFLFNIDPTAFRGPIGLYSALAAGVDGLKVSSAPAQGWKDAIKGLVNKGQVKQDEIEWSGINDWLDLQQGRVTKQQVTEYLQQGGIQVEETVLGGSRNLPPILIEYFENTSSPQPTTTEGWIAGAARTERKAQQFQAQGQLGLAKRFFEIAEAMNEYAESGEIGALATKYSTYTLPGGENYREVLLRLPTGDIMEAKQKLTDFQRKMREKYDVALAWRNKATPAERAEGDRLLAAVETTYTKYRSSHWNQPNVLAHIRINDRTDADGKRVLFVEEIQSDWGQAGRKGGFKLTDDQLAAERERLTKEHNDYVREESNALNEELRGIKAQLRELPAGQDRDEATRLRNREESIYRQLRMLAESRPSEPSDSGIQAAPFVTKTEGWLNLALKRIMVMAAEGGYDKVAFVNGEQSADRYDLSKQVDSIYITKLKRGGFEFTARQDGREIVSRQTVPDAAALADAIGKELAERADKQELDTGKSYSGIDLKVGGEGMKAFYDKIVPTALKKLLPKVGGGQIEAVGIGSMKTAQGRRDEALLEELGVQVKGKRPPTQMGFDVTDKMRALVERGLPLFNAQEPSLAEQEGDLLFTSKEIRDEKIKEYAKLRASVARMTKQIAEGKASIDLQRNLTQTMQAMRELQAEIKATVPRSDSPEDFYAKALKEYSAGNISEEVLNVIKAMYQRHPGFLEGLQLSVAQGKDRRTAGSFIPWTRIVRLYKSTAGTINPETIRHEIAHSLEQLMTDAQRKVVIQAWGKALQRAIKQNPDEQHQEFFNAVNNFLSNPTERSLTEAIGLLPSYSMYQYVSPSEFWAVNSERLMAAELGTAWDRFKSGVRRLFEALKEVLGFDNRSDVHNVFRQIMTGDITDRRQATLVDVFGKFELQNIQDDKDLLDRYARPNTPKLDSTPIRTLVIDQFKNGKDLIKEAATNPTGFVSDQATNVVDGLIAARTKAVWYGAGLESRDFDQYKGQLRTGEGAVIASVALDNAIRSGNIGVEVIFRGGIEYNPKQGNYVAVERDLGMRGVYEAEAKLKKKLGDQVGTDIIQAYLEAKRSISIMNELRDRTEALENAKENLKILQQMQAPPDDIKQAKELVAETQTDVDSIQKAASSVNMSEDEMYEFAARDQAHPELGEIMKNWSAINQNLLRMWRQVGLLSQGRYETLSKIKDYVPWYRITSDDEDIHAPAQTAIQSTTRSMTNIGREKLFKRGKPVAVMDFRAKAGQKDFKIEPSSVVRVKVNDKPIDPALVTATASGEVRVDMDLKDNDLVTFETNREIQNIIDNMTRNVMRMTMNGIRQFAANRIVLEHATRNTENKVKLYPSVDKAKGRFNWVVNGRKVVVEIQDPLVAASIYGMENINLKMWAPLAAVANLTRRSITLSGVFQVKQVFKDAPTAALVTGVRNPLALIGGVWKGFLTSLVQPAIKKGGADIEPVIDILKAAGIGGFHSPARTPEAEIKRRLGIMNRNVFSAMIKALDHIGDASDMAQRVATYKRVLAETGDEAQALYQAANVINFLHHGSAGFAQAAVKLVPFMGAYANSMDVLVNALMGGGLKGMSRQKALARLAVTGTMLTSLTLLYCMLAGADPEYDELDDQTKLRNIIIPGTKIMLPMNTSAAFFFKVIPELIYNKVTREGTENEYDSRRLRRALGQAARDALLGPEPIPAGVKPVLEVAINYNFFTGRPITPEGLKGVEAAEQYAASTSELGKRISELLAIPGTDGRRVLNPIEADHLVRGIFGTAGSMAQWMSNSIGVAAETRPELTERETPIIGSFMRPDIPRGREDLFYDFKELAEKKYKTYMKMIEREDDEAADKYLEKHGDVAGMYEYITETEQDLQELNAEIRRVATSRSKDMSPKERRELITEYEQIKQDVLEPVKELRREVIK